MKESIKLFEEKKVRALWNETEEEGNETVINCHGLKMLAPDGKIRLTDIANTEQLFSTIELSPERALSNSVWQRHTVNEQL
jgi:hypothetical protein